MQPLGGFDFSIEFSEQFCSTLLAASLEDKVVPSQFSYDDRGEPGLVNTRFGGGSQFFKSYLVDLEVGYVVGLRKPMVAFHNPGETKVSLAFEVAFQFPRNLVAAIFDLSNSDTALSYDPAKVDPHLVYPEEFRSGPPSNPYPGKDTEAAVGTIEINFPIEKRPFDSGWRLAASTSGVTWKDIRDTQFPGIGDANLQAFTQAVLGRASTYLVKNEVNDFDLTPLVGDLSAYGVVVREPIVLITGRAGDGSGVLAYAANIQSTVDDGDPGALSFNLSGGDLCISFSESMFVELLDNLRRDPQFPLDYGNDGLPDPNGTYHVGAFRLELLDEKVSLKFPLTKGTTTYQVDAALTFSTMAEGVLGVVVDSIQTKPQLSSALVLNIVLTLSFQIFGAVVGVVLAAILQNPRHNSLDAGLSEFIRKGALAFSFRAPIRGTQRVVEAVPMSLAVSPGIMAFNYTTRVSA